MPLLLHPSYQWVNTEKARKGTSLAYVGSGGVCNFILFFFARKVILLNLLDKEGWALFSERFPPA